MENKIKGIRDLSENDYNKELVDLKLTRLYIDDVKRNVQDFKDINMFGTLLNLCSYELNVGSYELINVARNTMCQCSINSDIISGRPNGL